jgi:hypothetical protein
MKFRIAYAETKDTTEQIFCQILGKAARNRGARTQGAACVCRIERPAEHLNKCLLPLVGQPAGGLLLDDSDANAIRMRKRPQ